MSGCLLSSAYSSLHKRVWMATDAMPMLYHNRTASKPS